MSEDIGLAYAFAVLVILAVVGLAFSVREIGVVQTLMEHDGWKCAAISQESGKCIKYVKLNK